MKKRYSLLIICYYTLVQINGQVITNYTTSDGLIDNFVECLDVDSQDNIWFGTSMGLQMFDGENWVTYNTTDYPDMVGDNIKVIRAMNNGDIWIGTDFGACRFDGSSWTTFDNTNGLNHNIVKSIDEAADGMIWVGTMTGISYYDGSEWGTLESPHWSGVNVTIAESSDHIWFGSPLGGITFYDGEDYTTYDSSDGLINNNTTDLLIDNDGNKWIGTDIGISVLDENNLNVSQFTQMYILPPPDTLNQIVDLDMDSEGRIWAGIYVGYLGVGGVAMWDGNDWIDYDESDGLVGPNIRGLEIDSYDNVWVATGTGVSKIGNQTSEISDIEQSRVSVYPNPCNRVLNSIQVILEIQGEPGTYLIQLMKGNSPQNIEVVPVMKL
jgi:ligand-binding sensor domain-containing protein